MSYVNILPAIFIWCNLLLSGFSFRSVSFPKVYVSSSGGKHCLVLSKRRGQASGVSPISPFIHAAATNGDESIDNAQTQQLTSNAADPNSQQQQGAAKAPTFNGKVVYPLKAFQAGLSAQAPVAAVYAILNSGYKRGKNDGWDHCVVYVGVTRNLHSSLAQHLEKHGPQTVANVRALSFSFPQLDTMKDVSSQWKDLVHQSTGASYLTDATLPALADELNLLGLADFISSIEEEEDDDEDMDMDDFYERGSEESSIKKQQDGTVISPFLMKDTVTLASAPAQATSSLTREHVDKVLEEVRPYLISDGGNVSVVRVDESNGDVYLKLEGACGSCASSTVTMKMGIERVLKESFPTLGQVIQVVEDVATASQDLTYVAVQTEVLRLLPAITAMSGSVEIVNVDSSLGIVELRFQGASRVRTGLELALRDVPSVKEVKFLD